MTTVPFVISFNVFDGIRILENIYGSAESIDEIDSVIEDVFKKLITNYQFSKYLDRCADTNFRDILHGDLFKDFCNYIAGENYSYPVLFDVNYYYSENNCWYEIYSDKIEQLFYSNSVVNLYMKNIHYKSK